MPPGTLFRKLYKLELDRSTRSVVATKRNGSIGDVLEMVLRQTNLIMWTDVVRELMKTGWDLTSALRIMEWIDKNVPLVHANGRVDPEALVLLFTKAGRHINGHARWQMDPRKLTPLDRLLRNHRWLSQLYSPKRISNAKIRAAVGTHVVLEGDRELIEGILSTPGIVTTAGNVRPTKLRGQFEAYGFDIKAYHVLDLAKLVRGELEPAPAAPPAIIPVEEVAQAENEPPTRSRRRVVHAATSNPVTEVPGHSRSSIALSLLGAKPDRAPKIEVTPISKRMWAAHRSLVLMGSMLEKHHSWPCAVLLNHEHVVAVVEEIWSKSSRKVAASKAIKWLIDAGLIKQMEMTLEDEYGEIFDDIYVVVESPLATIRHNDWTNTKPLERDWIRERLVALYDGLPEVLSYDMLFITEAVKLLEA